MARQVVSGGTADPHSGRKIAKYEILTRLSVGGMAELFLAFTKGPGGFRKFVALKQILPDVKTDEFVQMFLDEARITAAFSHPNIGQVFDLGLEDDELYLAMEFLPGQNLEQVLMAASRVRPLPIGFAARVARDVCLGLHYAHHFTAPSGRKVAVVHRDMAPRNVMITYDGVVKVIDFGIAKAKGRIARTHVGMVKGTSGYMSPEQVRGYELDGRSDLFTAGVLLHEMLCGRRLFDTSNEDAMMRQIANADIQPPRAFNPDVPEVLDAVVMRALAKEPAKRFSTGREMAKAIEAAVGTEIFDEEAIAELMLSLFAEKRLQTLALLDQPTGDDERVSQILAVLRDVKTHEQTIEVVPDDDDASDIRPTQPMIKLPHDQPPLSRPPPMRVASAQTRSVGPPAARAFPAAPRAARPDSSSRKPTRLPDEQDAPTQVGPVRGSPEHPASPEPAAPESRRSPKVEALTLDDNEEPSLSEMATDPKGIDVEHVAAKAVRASRVTQAWQGMRSRGRRALWFVIALVVMGLAVLFLPEPLRSKVGDLFASASRWVSERVSPPPAVVPQQQPVTQQQPETQPPSQPQAQPEAQQQPPSQAQPQPPSQPAAQQPGMGAGTAAPPRDAYEPPAPAEPSGSQQAAGPPSAPVSPTPTSPSPSTPPTGTRSKKLDSPGVRGPKSGKPVAKPVVKPVEEPAEEPAEETEDAQEQKLPEGTLEPLPLGKPLTPEILAPPEPMEEDPSESEDSSVGPAEVDPSIRPLEGEAPSN